MKKTKKILICCFTLAVIAAASVLGTFAYLTDSDSAINTFTVGQIQITVDEAKVNEDGTLVIGADRVKANEYHLLPGMTYTKDPTITVKAGSEESYLRMILTVHNADDVKAILDKYNLGDFSALIGGWNKDTWVYEGYTEDTTVNTISFEFRYKESVGSGTSDVVLPALFDTLKVPGEITKEEMKSLYDGGLKIEVFGHAIQKSGFENADYAWSAFDKHLQD